ncbi:MAG: capsule assembly Wzi family protein [Steroidobacteraceae bacterium]
MTVSLALWNGAAAFGEAPAGVTPYLPLNLDPDVENAIERVLILGDKPVMSRPIRAALVLDALPKACQVDRPLCERVRRFLDRYMQSAGVEFVSLSAAATLGSSNTTLPNQHGEKAQSPYEVAGAAYIQPNAYMLLNVGGEAHQGRVTPTGSMLSLGFDFAQLDLGWRDHWWSPMTDSSMLISTEAPTMPGVTLSNYRPLTRLGIHYEVFAARMSESSRIVLTTGELTRGDPNMGGTMVSIEPVSGWALSAQRVLIWGGGEAGPVPLSQVLSAFFDPAKAQSNGFGTGTKVVGKQEASFTSRLIFPSRHPFSVYFEYAGNDTNGGQNFLFGKATISAGIDFPHLGPFDLTYEITSFSPTWYVHGASAVQTGYLDGIVNYGDSIGHWFGDQRVSATPSTLADEVGGQSNMLRLGWTPSFGGYMQLQLRALANEAQTVYATFPYRNEYLGSLSYSHPWHGFAVGGELDAGRDVFGNHYVRIEGHLRDGEALFSGGGDSTSAFAGERPKGNELYVQVGANYYLVQDSPITNVRLYSPWTVGPHFAIGAWRRASEHQDLGASLDVDDMSGRGLLGLHMLDYRYRFGQHLAFHAFAGAARYSVGTPAYGFYLGGGPQWRDVVPGWDVGFEYHRVILAERLRDLPSDPQGGDRPDAYDNLYSWGLYVTRKF